MTDVEQTEQVPEVPPLPELTEDMSVEEVMPDLKDAAEQNKGFKKIQKLADRIVAKMNGRINGERDIIRRKMKEYQDQSTESFKAWTTQTNDNLAIFQKKYESMYSYLVRQFLVNLEQRVFTNEIFVQGVLDVVVKRLYELEKVRHSMSVTDGTEFIPYEEFLKNIASEHEAKMNELANAIANKQAQEAKAAKEAQGVKQSEPTKHSVGGQSNEGTQANTEDGGTDSGTDSQEVESSAEG